MRGGILIRRNAGLNIDAGGFLGLAAGEKRAARAGVPITRRGKTVN